MLYNKKFFMYLYTIIRNIARIVLFRLMQFISIEQLAFQYDIL